MGQHIEAVRPMGARGRRAIAVAWALAGVALLAPIVNALWTSRPFLLDVAAQPTQQIGLVQVLAGAVLMALRRTRLGALSAGAGMLLIALSWRGAPAPVGGEFDPDHASLSLVLFNADGDSGPIDPSFIEWVEEMGPDILCVIESPWRTLNDNEDLDRLYEHQIEPYPGWQWAMSIYSRHPVDLVGLAEPTTREIKHSFLARRSAVVTHDSGTRFLLAMTHPPSPRNAESWRRSLAHARREGSILRRWSEARGMPAVLAADTNSAPSGRLFRELRRASGLVGWTPRFGAGTWPAWLPPALALPIDRVWTSPAFVVRSFEVGPRFRSDHRPIFVTLDLGPVTDQGSSVPESGPALTEPAGGDAR